MLLFFKNKYKTYSYKIGMNRAIGFTIIQRIVQLFSGALTIYFTTKYLTQEELGYNYTFQSILNMQVFFELGLGGIITQFVAHEMAHLQWENKNKIVGNQYNLSRLASLLHFSTKWYLILSVFLFTFIYIVGNIFFIKSNPLTLVNWKTPWLIICLITTFNFIITGITSFYEGLGKVKEMAKLRLVMQIGVSLSILFFLYLNLKLFANPFANLIGILILIIGLFKIFTLLKNIWHEKFEHKISFKNEIFPFQWKIALSWLSGYFIFQLFNPIAFVFSGPIIAGKLGISLVVLNVILSVSMSWISTKIPTFSQLIALKKWQELDHLFKRTLKHSSFVCILCIVCFIFVLYLLNFYHFKIAQRFLSIPQIILLSLTTFCTQFIGALASYLRCHKEEPFLVMSIISAILVTITCYFCAKYFGINGMIIGFLIINVLYSLPYSIYIYYSKRKLWHQ